jgi:hypothetical protein
MFSYVDPEAAIGLSHILFLSTISVPPRLLSLKNTHNIGAMRVNNHA